MARQYAKFKTDMWRLDDDLRGLPREAQHLYFVLTTGPDLSLAGVTDWRPNRIAKLAHGWTRKQVADAAAILAERRFILLDEDTEEVLIRTFIKHDELLRSHTTAAGVVTAWGSIYSPRLRGAVADEVSKLAEMGLPDRVVRAIAPILDYPSEGVSHGVSDGVSNTPHDGPTRQTANSRLQTAERPDVAQILDHLDRRIEENGARKPSRSESNVDAARRLLDTDGRTVDEVVRVIDWATSDAFWKSNILSAAKLRKQYDQLRLKLNSHAALVRPSSYRIEEDWSA